MPCQESSNILFGTWSNGEGRRPTGFTVPSPNLRAAGEGKGTMSMLPASLGGLVAQEGEEEKHSEREPDGDDDGNVHQRALLRRDQRQNDDSQ